MLYKDTYYILASSSLSDFLTSIDFNFIWQGSHQTFDSSLFDKTKQPKIYKIEQVQNDPIVYAVHLRTGLHGEFILVYITENEEEFDRLIYVYQDHIGRGEIEIIGGARINIEDWLRYNCFLPDLSYAEEAMRDAT